MKRALPLVVAACSATPADVEPIGEYWTEAARADGWLRVDTWGETPGHGDTYRIIYASPEARMFDGLYPLGTTLVKEVYDKRFDYKGSLRVIEIMRVVDHLQQEWLFTAAGSPQDVASGIEVEKDFCWRRCHVNAPINGAWFDYSQFLD